MKKPHLTLYGQILFWFFLSPALVGGVLFHDRDDQSARYWVALAVPLHSREFRHPPQGILVASTDSLEGNDLFFHWRPWVWTVAAALLVSVLTWFPFVHRVSRRLRKLTAAAESISEGDFAVQVAGGRTDEPGRLSRAVQRMAARLDELVAGQERFLGDIAHELCSPLVRARMSMGIPEQNAGEEDRAKLDSITEEVEEFSQPVNELLDFSKASLKPRELPREPVSMEALARDLVAREATDREVALLVDSNMKLTTNEGLLRRALGNVLHNAVRYADPGDEIVLRCAADRTGVLIQVLDRGPGVPEDWVDRMFEPFSRPERAPTRETGGSGLGLAMARTCAGALGGTVRGRIREGGGFAADFRFPPTP